jgi:branched-chain amino acid transport system substrate-binding protein
MKRNSIYSIAVILTVCLGMFLSGCGEKTGTIKIGVILPLTGDIASYGLDCKDGISFAIEELYQDKATLFFEDSKGEAKTAVTAYNKLVNLNKVDYVIGDVFSGTTLAVAPLANKDKKLLISPTASSMDIPANGIYSISVYPSETFESEIIADFVNSKYNTTGVLYEKVAASQTMCDAFVNSCKVKLSYIESFESNTTDFNGILFKLKQAGIESVYLITYTNNAIKILNHMKTLKITTNVIGPSSLFDPSIYPYLDNSTFDFYLTGPAFSAESNDTDLENFSKTFSASYSKLPNQMAFQGYIATIVANDFYLQIKTNNYNERYLKKYQREILGKSFTLSNNLTSQLGLVLYEFKNDEFKMIK